MMKNILIIGCGLIGSSLVRAIVKKKISKNIFVYEKSKKNILKIKKLNLQCILISDFKNVVPKIDLIIFWKNSSIVRTTCRIARVAV